MTTEPDSSTVECPTCSQEFTSETGMKIHHSNTHGESLAFATVTCDYCGEERQKRRTQIEKTEHHYCDTNCQLNHQIAEDRHPAEREAKVDIDCTHCGTTLTRYQSHVKPSQNHFCS